ncbi:MAG: hypothetical protein AAGJ35_01540, partial [Myxococcota bacterium]
MMPQSIKPYRFQHLPQITHKELTLQRFFDDKLPDRTALQPLVQAVTETLQPYLQETMQCQSTSRSSFRTLTQVKHQASSPMLLFSVLWMSETPQIFLCVDVPLA